MSNEMRSSSGCQGMDVRPHPIHPRVQRIALEPSRLQHFFAACRGDTTQSLEYVPFSRFLVAKQLEQAMDGHLSACLRDILHNRAQGAIAISIADVTTALDDAVKFATAAAHLIGVPNHDSMTGTYYARFRVMHEDSSDSYLRQAYRPLTLHTDGTYVGEPTDWLLMMKSFEQHAAGGRSRLLHLDDWNDLAAFAHHPLARHEFLYRSPPSKRVPTAMKRPTFEESAAGICISFIDQFAQPETIAEAEFLHDLSTSLENSPDTKCIPLEVGELLLVNNHFWLHGREAFGEHADLVRELIRLRGRF